MRSENIFEGEPELETEAGKAVTAALACALLGGVAVNSALLYLVNSRNNNVRKATYEVLSGALSIFCSLNLFYASKKALDLVQSDLGSHKGVRSFIGFLLAYLCLQLLFWCSRHYQFDFHGLSIVGAHVVAFWGMDAFGRMVYFISHIRFFDGWPEEFEAAALLLGVAVLALLIVGLCFLADAFRNRWTNHQEAPLMSSNMSWKAWMDQCKHAENESAGTIIGFLWSMAIRFCITCEVPNIHGSPRDKTALQLFLLGVAAWCSLIIQVCVTEYTHSLRNAWQRIAWKSRLLDLASEICIMTTGWLWWYSATWFWFNEPTYQHKEFLKWKAMYTIMSEATQMQHAMILAISFSATSLSIVVIVQLVLHRLHESVVHGIVGSLVLGVGFSWEGAFYTAIASIANEYKSKIAGKAVSMAMQFGLLALVLPAWAWYILPKTHDEHDHDGTSSHGVHSQAIHGSKSAKDRPCATYSIRGRVFKTSKLHS